MLRDLNTCYSLFQERHPTFEQDGGQVHIIGHSLGSVIMMDIVCKHNFTRLQVERHQHGHSSHQNRHHHHSQRTRHSTSSTEDDRASSPIDLSDVMIDRSMSNRSSKERLDDNIHSTSSSPRKLSKRKSVLFSTPFHRFKDPVSSSCLMFPVAKLFSLGSPLSLFTLLQGSRIGPPLSFVLKQYKENTDVQVPDNESVEQWIARNSSSNHWQAWYTRLHSLWSGTQEFLYPDTESFYHIFHPSDPIAYRMESIVSSKMASHKPSIIQSVKGKWRAPDLSGRAHGILESLRGSLPFSKPQVANDSLTPENSNIELNFMSRKNSKSKESRPLSKSRNQSIDGYPQQDYGNPITPRLPAKDIVILLNPRQQRLDFCLQEGMLDSAFLSSLFAHTNYWRDADMASFMLQEIMSLKTQE